MNAALRVPALEIDRRSEEYRRPLVAQKTET